MKENTQRLVMKKEEIVDSNHETEEPQNRYEECKTKFEKISCDVKARNQNKRNR